MSKYLGSCWKIEELIGKKSGLYCCISCHTDDEYKF